MAITTRQTSLLVQQDWKTLYQTFREADFQSYDFETLRKSMIDYLRTYYPEDFNDFIESSEYVALIDLIAFLGQSLAFRTDLNARENFLDTAERRDSVLKLARLISYSPKRAIPSSGFLKIDSVQTSETVTDSNGLNLANLLINWNDSGNDMWLEQFTAILDATLLNSQTIGIPSNRQILSGVQTDEYTVNLVPGVIPTYKFTATVEGADMMFEAISGSSAGKTYVYETEPKPQSKFNVIYKNDNLGNSSQNTGYFVYFKQGDLKYQDFTVTDSLPNRVVSINFDNINNSDVWLYQLDSRGQEQSLWTQVPAVAGINIIYNNTTDRNLYQVNTRSNDQVDLVFGDGAFANIPQGTFRVYYRQSNGLTYKITPDEMQNIVIPLSYVSRTGRVETLTVRASLHYTVANATARESIDEIRAKAPQQYYTQNRMITGEDYNLLPYTLFSTILKSKAVNRTSSGVSRYLDVLDVSGKYSSTNVFAQDGWLYKNDFIRSFSFQWNTVNDIKAVIYEKLMPLLTKKELQHLYYANFERFAVSDTMWYSTSTGYNQSGSIGYLSSDSGDTPLQLGINTGTNLKYVTHGALIRFSAGPNAYFNAQNQIVSGTPSVEGDKLYIYAAAMLIDGTTITFNVPVPTGSLVDQIIPVMATTLSTTLIDSIQNLIQTKKKFGLRYSLGTTGAGDVETVGWHIVESPDLPDTFVPYDFNLSTAGITTGVAGDYSWLINFVYNGVDYTVNYRGTEYVFESKLETRFYFDNTVKVYDTSTGTIVRDQIKVLKINNQPDVLTSTGLGEDQVWYVYKNVIESDGYQNTKKILITFPDANSDGVPDNPDLFENIVSPTVNTFDKYVYLQSQVDPNRFLTTVPYDKALVVSKHATSGEIAQNLNSYNTGQIFYATSDRKFFTISLVNNIRKLVERTDMAAYVGRQNLYFQYRHNSPNYRRIDPSPNNIVDLYMLTKQYSTDYLAWIKDTSGVLSEPSAPTAEALKTEFGTLENYKAMSDTVVYNPAKFKPLFGVKANASLQATFKVVKNSNVVVSDNDVKTSVIAAINNYFDINNWDFGETFYFSELSAYLHAQLSPNIASIIIVPSDTAISFGNLYQINAEANEIIVSAATVDNVEIISSITAAQINQTLGTLVGT